MWWSLIARRLKRKPSKATIKVLAFLMLFAFFSSLVYVYNSSLLIKFMVNKEADRIMKKVKRTDLDLMNFDIGAKFPDLDLNASPQQNSGVRGNGLNLLLIGNIKTEGYVKELLELYRDSAQGKLTDTKHHATVRTLIGVHLSESAYFPGSSVLLNSYLPWNSSSKKVHWNEPYDGLPASALTLRMFNSNTAKVLNIGFSYNGVGNNTYVNAFNIHNSYFGKNYYISKLNGYNVTGTRSKSDPYYLPDSLAYVDSNISTIVESYLQSETSDLLIGQMYAIYHNAGPGAFPSTNGFGVNSGKASTYITPLNNYTRSEYSKHVKSISQSIDNKVREHGELKSASFTKSEAIVAGVLMLLEDGYYLTERSYKVFDGGLKYTSTLSLNRTNYLAPAYNKLYGTNLSTAEVQRILKSKVKTISEAYPEYTEAEIREVYGSEYLDLLKGGVWKLSTETSSVYKKKLKGKDPRVLNVMNPETIGQMFSVRAQATYAYANLLKYAGVDVDPTNPADVLEKVIADSGGSTIGGTNTFIPESGEFSAILKRIGAELVHPKAMDMLQEGYNASGLHYVWGGKGEIVSEANFKRVWDATFSNKDNRDGAQRSLYNNIYITKDGTDPKLARNRKDTNLVNYGKQMFDCSGLVSYAWRNTIGNGSGAMTISSTAMYNNTTRLHKIERKDAKAGDLIVAKGHVYFFLAENSKVNMTAAESKTENWTGANTASRVWALEAPNTGNKVGIRLASTIRKGGMITKRFNDFRS